MAAKKKKPASKKAARKTAAPKKPAKKPASKKAAPKKPAKKAAKKPAPKKPAKKAAPQKAAPKKAAPKKAAPKKAAPPKSAPRAGGKRLSPGRIVWHDLMTTDIDRAQSFYTQLLPWKTRPVDVPPLGLTRRIEVDGAPLGGLVSLPASEGIGSHWMPYVLVEDLEGVVRKVRDLDGYVPVPPTPLEKIGRFAVIADPRGAHVSPMAMTGAMPDSAEAKPGQAYWTEVLTDDIDSTTSFFADVFGWERSTMDMGDSKYTIFMDGSAQRAGAMSNPAVPPQWLTYFLVDNLALSFAKAQALGAEVVQPIAPIPGLGKAAFLKDPTGALFALFEET